MSENIFEYAMLKSETTSEIVFFIHVIPSWINHEIDLSYNNNELIISLNQKIFTSKMLPQIAQDWLNYHRAKVYFTNDDGIIISETIVEKDIKEMYGTEN